MRALLSLCLCAVVAAQTHTHGDVAGELAADRVLIWTRASGPASIKVVYGRDENLASPRESAPVAVDASSDFTAKIALTELRADTVYYYATEIGDERGPIGRFRTAPRADRSGKLVFAFSGDVAEPGHNELFAKVAAHEPAFYVSLGDLPYADGATTLDEYRAKHRATRADPLLHAFFRRVPIYAVWDDHEVSNDWDRSTPAENVANGTAAWREWLPVPAGEIWRSVRWGRDAELFLLDCRAHRDVNEGPDGADKTMLGEAQLRWLVDGLITSTARFKIVCTSVPLRFGTTGSDHWNGFRHERAQILAAVAARGITDVVFLSADQHWAAAHDHPEGVVEFQAGPMSKATRRPPTRPDPAVRFLAEQHSYGVVTIDGTRAEPELTVELFGKQGRLHRGVVAGQRAARVRVANPDPAGRWSLRGPHRFADAGRDIALQVVPPGDYRLGFAAGEGARPPSLDLALPENADARVAVAGERDDVLFAADFGQRPVDLTIVDEGGEEGPSAWALLGGVLVQSSNVHSAPRDREHAHKPGTMAIVGDAAWRDVTVRVAVRPFDDDAVGVVFRYRDPRNYYRFSMDRERRYRRVVAVVAGEVTVLAEDTVPYAPDTWCAIEVSAAADRLRVRIDGAPTFDVRDASHSAGRAGLYTWGSALTEFDDLVVLAGDAGTPADPSREELVRETFADADLGDWTAVGVRAETEPPYAVRDGVLAFDEVDGEVWLLSGADAGDARAMASVRAPRRGRFGLAFRYRGAKNHYRFVWDATTGDRRLERVVDGESLVLFEGSRRRVCPGLWHRIECQAVGFQLEVTIDDEPFCALLDGAHSAGTLGLWCSDTDAGLCFDDVVVGPPQTWGAVFAAVRDGSAVALRGRSPLDVDRRFFLALSGSCTLGARLTALGPHVLPLDDDALLWSTLTGTKERRAMHGFVDRDGSWERGFELPDLPELHGRTVWAGGWLMDPRDLAPGLVLPPVEIVRR